MTTSDMDAAGGHNDLNESLRYFHDYFVAKYTPKIFGSALKWGYVGGDQPWKETLFQVSGYDMKQYEGDFSPCERDFLENNHLVDELNTQLLYKLLCKICNLSADANEWVKENTQHPNLEHLLYKIMINFNEIVQYNLTYKGEVTHMNLENTQKLFKSAMKEIGNKYVLSESSIHHEISEMEKEYTVLCQKMGESLSQEDVEIFSNIKKECLSHNPQLQMDVQQSIIDELVEHYTHLKKHNNVNLFENDNELDIDDKSSKLIVKKDPKFLFPLDQSGCHREVEKEVSLDEIFHITLDDETIPKLITIQGIDGIGKSKIQQKLAMNWMQNPINVKRSHGFDALIFIQHVDLNCDNLSELIANMFTITQRNFAIGTKQLEVILLCMNLLFVICDYNGKYEISKKLLAEILELPGQIRVVCEVAAQCENVDKFFPEQVSKINVYVQCLMPTDRPIFIDRNVGLLCGSQNDKEEIKSSLINYLQLISPKLHSIVCIPLLLKQLTMLWIDSPENVEYSITLTEMLFEVNKMLMNNLAKQMKQARFDNEVSLQSRLETLDKFFTELAFFSWVKEENVIDYESVVMLKNKCTELKINSNEFLGAFLNSKDYMHKNKTLQTYAFQNRLTHAFDSANYIASLILLNSIQKNNEEQIKERKSIIKELLENIYDNQYILMCLTGILTSTNTLMLNDTCYDIIELTSCDVSDKGCLEVDKLLQNVVESVNDLDFTRAVAFRLDELYRSKGCNEWRISNPTVLCTFPSLLDFTYPVDHELNIRSFAAKMPSHLCLDLIDQPSSATLKTALMAITEREINLNINLLCHYNPGGDISDSVLETLNRSGNKCILTTFLGRLSDTAIQWLPNTLETICLKIDFNGLLSLNQHLPTLNYVSSLDILIDGLPRKDSIQLQCLPYSGKHLWIRLQMPDLSDEDLDCEFVCQTFKQVWPQQRNGEYSMIGVYGTKLTEIGCEHILRSLQFTGISTNIVVFGTSSVIMVERSTELNVLAGQLGLGQILIEP